MKLISEGSVIDEPFTPSLVLPQRSLFSIQVSFNAEYYMLVTGDTYHMTFDEWLNSPLVCRYCHGFLKWNHVIFTAMQYPLSCMNCDQGLFFTAVIRGMCWIDTWGARGGIRILKASSKGPRWEIGQLVACTISYVSLPFVVSGLSLFHLASSLDPYGQSWPWPQYNYVLPLWLQYNCIYWLLLLKL